MQSLQKKKNSCRSAASHLHHPRATGSPAACLPSVLPAHHLHVGKAPHIDTRTSLHHSVPDHVILHHTRVVVIFMFKTDTLVKTPWAKARTTKKLLQTLLRPTTPRHPQETTSVGGRISRSSIECKSPTSGVSDQLRKVNNHRSQVATAAGQPGSLSPRVCHSATLTRDRDRV